MQLKLDTEAIPTLNRLSPEKGKDELFIWDTDLEGFGLRLRRRVKGGLLRTWVVQYRSGGRQRRQKLGPLEKLNPKQARTAAQKIFASVTLGHDPQGEKQAQRREATRTFRAVVADYLAAKEQELRPVSLRIAKLYLTGRYFKALRSLAVTAIKRSDIAGCIRSITRNRSTATAAAARRAVSAFFAWCIAEGLLGDGANPVDGSHRPDDPKPRERVLSDAELVAVWKACGDDDFGRIVRLLILTGARRQEISGLPWSELEDGTWTLPAERAKNGREHKITLPPAAREIIDRVPRRAGRDQLFGDRAERGFTSWSRGKQDLEQRLNGSVGAWRIHDIRRTVASGMIGLHIPSDHVEAVLNHYGGHRRGVAGVYNRYPYEKEIALALLNWSKHVLALVEGRRESKIVTLRSTG
jgi:integrase